MYFQIIELLTFAIIAFLIISKLISILGTTSDDEDLYNKSFFGEIKNVTQTSQSDELSIEKFKQSMQVLSDIFVERNKSAIIQGLFEVKQKIPSFNPMHFVNGALAAFKMIIEAVNNNDSQLLTSLVDKRYISRFLDISSYYGQYNSQENDLEGKISEIYTFGNNVFIKILFVGKTVTNKVNSLNEEWTFSKSALNRSNIWQLTNIDRL